MAHQMQTVFSLMFILFAISTIGYQISSDIKQSAESNNKQDLLMREKRQLENFDTDDTATNEQEPGFWDRIVKVALRLFNKFIEWLNSA